jgi:Transglutaminase-like superfamily
MKLETRRRVYLREAALMLMLARLAVHYLPPARVFAWANRPLRLTRRFADEDEEAGWISWAIESLGANIVCLPRALAAHAMLRRRGIASTLCLGVAREQNAFDAHAWVEVGAKRIIGGEEADGFTRLAEFGGASR